jgi:isocitrate dehydrogenase (NAD+)
MKSYEITLIPGDGIGPEVTDAAVKILAATGTKINWDVVNAGKTTFEEIGELVPDNVYQSIEKNKIALKGPITTPLGSGFRSINVALRKKYDLYANIRPIKSLDGSINMVIYRENTEGLYIGIEKKISDDHFESIKKITRKGSERILKKAFEYAKKTGKDKVTVVHKANILKMTDGLFLNIARETAATYDIPMEDFIIDNMCMQMVMDPGQFDLVVTMNLYGDILSDLGAGLVGGLGLIPGANIGEDIAIFEAVHGSAPDIAGKGYANPIAVTRSAALMLRHLGELDRAQMIEDAIDAVLRKGRVKTRDLGGTNSTNEITEAIISEMKVD